MRTNHSGVTEVAHIRTDKEKFDDNYVHVFQKDKCQCDECKKAREEEVKKHDH
jgi:hypothetical protein